VTEAVIVATARTPIGRAFKGSLKDIRPDDLSAQVVHGLLAKLPGLDPSTIDDLYWGCADPSGRHGSNMARVIAVLAGMDHLPAATINRFCASSTQTMRMAFHAIKAGEGDTFFSRRRRVRLAVHGFAGAGGSDADTQNPLFADAAARSAEMAAHERDLDRPARGGAAARRLPRDGSDGRERRDRARGLPARQDEWGVLARTGPSGDRRRASSSARSLPVTLPDGTVVSTDDGPRAGTTRGRPGLKPVFRENGTVTAGNCCPLNDGAAAVSS
jgi:acetyl-CoA C-acetyltransferase